MEEIVPLIKNVAILFIMLIPGIILKKCRLCSESFGKGISNFVLYIAQPVLIVYSYLECEKAFADIWLNILLTLIISLAVHGLFCAVALPTFARAPEARGRMLKFATIFSNAAFMGIPLIRACMNAEAAIYASVYNISFNLFLWTLGVFICNHEHGVDMDGDGDSDIKDALLSLKHHAKRENAVFKVLLHPVTLASVIGILVLVTGINTHLTAGGASLVLKDEAPELACSIVSVITDSMYMLKSLVAPLAMVVIGLRVPDISLRGFFNDVYMYIFILLRHFVLPFATLGALKLLILAGVPLGSDVCKVIVILAAAPAASSATMFAEKYDCDAAYVSRLVIVSTILSIGTMPLVLMLV